MNKQLIGIALGAFPLLAGQVPAADAPAAKVKIGFITTLSGPQAVMGTQMKDSAELTLDMLGGNLGGVPGEIVYGADQ